VDNVTPPGAVIPLTTPTSSVKLVTDIGFVAAFVTEREPLVCVLAKLVMLFVAFVVKSTVPAARTNKFFIVMPPDAATEIPAPLSNDITPVPDVGTKFVPAANVPIVISPEVPPPIRALVVRRVFNSACDRLSVPVPPPTPMVVPADPSFKITLVAFPVAAALPPICEVASNTISFAVKLIVPVESISEFAPVVIVPVPAL